MDEQPKVEERARIGSIEDVRKLLAGVPTAMLVTNAGGRLRARPMALQDPTLVSDADLWLVTADDSSKTDEIREDQQIDLCCPLPDGGFVSITARARIDDNPGEVQRLWKPDWKIWFPNEPADGRIALLKLTIERAEHWPAGGGRALVVYY